MRLEWAASLSPEDKAAFTLLHVYEKVRRKHQSGYKNFSEIGPQILSTSKFRTAKTVAAWFETRWKATRKLVQLEGYIEFAMRDGVLQIGQLKNEVKIKDFIKAAPSNVQVKERPVTDIYRRVLSDELKSTQALAMLGLLKQARQGDSDSAV